MFYSKNKGNHCLKGFSDCNCKWYVFDKLLELYLRTIAFIRFHKLVVFVMINEIGIYVIRNSFSDEIKKTAMCLVMLKKWL